MWMLSCGVMNGSFSFFFFILLNGLGQEVVIVRKIVLDQIVSIWHFLLSSPISVI